MKKRLSLDLTLFALMLLAFAYQLTGNRLHEIVGAAFVAFVGAHVILAHRWFRSLGKGDYPPHRIVATAVNLLLLAVTLLLAASGLANAHDVFSFFKVDAAILDRRVHAWAAYWMLVLASLHIGLHGRMLANEIRRLLHIRAISRKGALVLSVIAAAIVGFGVYAMWERDLALKLVGRYAFDYWDFERSTLGFFIRYAAIVAVGAALAHYGQKLLRKIGQGGF